MNSVRRMSDTVYSIVKRIDPTVIVQRAFYDEISGRLFVSLVKGRQEYEFGLPARYFSNGDLELVSGALKDGIDRMVKQPLS